MSIVQAVKLSARYVTERFLPDKAIDVMDEASARVRLRRITPPPIVRDLQRKINDIVRLKKDKIENQEFEKAVELRDQEEEIRRQIESHAAPGKNPTKRPNWSSPKKTWRTWCRV